MARRHHGHRRNTVRRSIAVALVLVLCLAGTPGAQQSPLSSPLNSDDPVQISADTMEADNRNRMFVFEGDVKVVQGDTVMTSKRLKVWYEDDDTAAAEAAGENGSRIRDIEAEGNVVILFDGRTAKSERALYSAEKNTLTLLGENASIVDGKNTISGAKITLYRAQDRITVESSRQGRVEAVFFPGDDDPGD